MKHFYFLCVGLLAGAGALTRAEVPAANIWPNATFEAGENLVLVTGTPTGWNRGGSNPAICQVSSENSVSASHSLALNDATTGYGEWYSDLELAGLAAAGDDLDLHWHEMFNVTGGEMRLTLTFFNASGAIGDRHFVAT